MNIIKPEVSILQQDYTVMGAYKMAEYAARTCYASTDKMKWKGDEDATLAFVGNLMKSGHGEPVECNAVYLVWDMATQDYSHDRYRRYQSNPYSRVRQYEDDTNCYVTTNLRVILENGWEDDFKYICEPIEGKHEPRITVLFKCQIVIASEINRYRKNSRGQRSTRYCNYAKGKFNGEINVSMPVDEDITEENLTESRVRLKNPEVLNGIFNEFMTGDTTRGSAHPVDYWLMGNLFTEFCYLILVNKFGWKAQRARRILPLDTNTEMAYTAYLGDWKHFIAQRSNETTGPAHPDVKIIADSLKEQFIEHGYLKPDEPLK